MSKQIIRALTFASALVVVFFACKKDLSRTGNNLTDGNSSAISLSESLVNRNQPLQASVTDGAVASWQVSPSEGVEIEADGSEATMLFAFAGNYTITAITNGIASQAHVSVTNQKTFGMDSVGDSTHNDSASIVLLTGDQIALKPVVANDSGLVLYSITQNKYQCKNNMLLYTSSVSGGGKDSTGSGNDSLATQTAISFTGVYVPAPYNCVSGTVRSKAFIYLPNYPLGTSPLYITLNGKTYKGSITTTKTYYQFNWPYISGVIISPKRIARN